MLVILDLRIVYGNIVKTVIVLRRVMCSLVPCSAHHPFFSIEFLFEDNYRFACNCKI